MGLYKLLLFFLLLTSCACFQRRTPVDTGFMETSKGAQIHLDTSDFPMLLVVDPDAEDWAEEVEWAAAEWNRLLGFNAFIYAGVSNAVILASPGVVPITIDQGMHGEAHTRYKADDVSGRFLSVSLIFPSGTYDERDAQIMALHELGHSLGLDHDLDLPLSIMNPVLLSQDEKPTEADLARVRLMFLHGLRLGTTTTPPIPPH